MSEARKLTQEEKATIRALKRLAARWPETLMLFSFSGSLIVVDAETGQMFDDILGIPNDGGDPGEDQIDGVSYLGR